MLMSILGSWRAWRQWSHANAEAKQLVGEAKRILKKKRYRIPESVAATMTAAVSEVEAARKGKDLERLRQAIADIDGKMDEHLAFARKSATRQYAESIGLALGVALLLRAFVVEAFQIPSGSMIPTLEVGDHIFVSKFAYAIGIPFSNAKIAELGKPRRGDIIVFKYPPDQSIDYIKRVVGLPGETLEVRHNEVFIDGRPMAREQLRESCVANDGAGFDGEDERHPCEVWLEHLDGKSHVTHQEPIRSNASDFGPVKIPPGHYFAMGDNRDNSKDSRVWGFVPFELIKGRALIIWWSRDPARGGLSPSGVADWFTSIRWRRFFQRVE
jgi:signal peptidase I, bacterial type